MRSSDSWREEKNAPDQLYKIYLKRTTMAAHQRKRFLTEGLKDVLVWYYQGASARCTRSDGMMRCFHGLQGSASWWYGTECTQPNEMIFKLGFGVLN